MITAYFETNSSSDVAGRYPNEEEYMKDLPRLIALAKKHGFKRVTESVDEEY
tara:strand:+ start:2377 stop:2532 length:156 start_codon:yes stop_codon:yes gene_type:complete